MGRPFLWRFFMAVVTVALGHNPGVTMSSDLVSRRCKPCEGGVTPLDADQAQKLLEALHADWSLSGDGLEIRRTFRFPAYSRSLGF